MRGDFLKKRTGVNGIQNSSSELAAVVKSYPMAYLPKIQVVKRSRKIAERRRRGKNRPCCGCTGRYNLRPWTSVITAAATATIYGEDDSDNAEDNVVRLPLQDNNPPPPTKEPLINLPPVTKYFIALLVAIHGALQLFSEEQRDWIYSHFGFVAGAYTGHAPFTVYAIAAPLTYMLLHGSWMHVGMNSVMLAAFGAGLERMMGGRKMLILFVLCGLAAIAVQFVAYPSSTDPVIGASGGITGLFAALLLVMQQMNGSQSRYGIWPLVLVWIAAEVGFGLTGAGPGGGNVAWVAHIGGFLAGLGLLRPVLRLPL